jgi:Uma2 family endonuclease
MVMVAPHPAARRRIRPWRPADLLRLPDDGNRYEVIEGQLFVTPAASMDHQRVLETLWEVVGSYVRAQKLGGAFFLPGDLHLDRKSQVIPDGMVIPFKGRRPRSWKTAAKPILVIECLSTSTRWRDRGVKRDLYRKRAIPEYWIVDRWERDVTVVRPNEEDRVEAKSLVWLPAGASAPLVIDLPALFRAALDD